MHKALPARGRVVHSRIAPGGRRFQANRIALFGCGALFGGAGLVNLYGGLFAPGESGSRFYLIMTALSVYLFFECRRYLMKADAFGLLAPVFLASILHFFLAYILPAAGNLFDPWILDRFAVLLWSPSDQLPEVALMIALAAFCMWRGYDAGGRLGVALRGKLQTASYLRSSFDAQMVFVIALQFFYFALVIYAMSLGIFGFNNSPEMMERFIQVREILNIGISAGALSLFLLLIFVYKRRAQGYAELGYYYFANSLVAINVFIGALSGFKSQIVFPFIVIIAAKFVATRKISIAGMIMAVCALFFAYQIVEPFRAYMGRNQLTGASDVGSTVAMIIESQRQKEMLVNHNIPWGTQVVSRLDLTGMTAVGAALDPDQSTVVAMREQLAESLYLFIPNAFIPRALWPSKETYSSGGWFSNVALGAPADATTSVAMGPVTWLYLLSGIPGVIIGFFLIGMVQAVIFEGIARAGAGGLIIYIAVAGTLSNIPTDIGPALAGMVRLMPIAFFAQFLLLKDGVQKYRGT